MPEAMAQEFWMSPDIDLDVLANALNGYPKEVEEKVLGYMPKKKQAMYTPIEGTVKKADVESARSSVLDIAKENAYTIVEAFNHISCDAFSPGVKDFAAGLDFLNILSSKSDILVIEIIPSQYVLYISVFNLSFKYPIPNTVIELVSVDVPPFP